MGGSRVSTRRSRAAVWAAVGVLVALGALGAFMELGRTREGSEQLDLYSTLSPAPDGTKALYVLLTEMGHDTRRLLGDFTAGDLEDADVVVMMQPMKPISAEEEDLLLDWIEGGGTVLMAGQVLGGSGLYSRPRKSAEDPFAYHDPSRGNLPKTEGEEDWTREPSTMGSSLLEGVDALAWVPLLMQKEREIDVDGAAPMWRRGAHTVLITNRERSFLEVTTLGEGRVVKVTDVDLLLNTNIRRGRNLVLVLNVLAQARGKGRRMLFDEGHRRMDAEQQASIWDVLGPASEVAFLQLILAAAVALLAIGWRRAPALAERIHTRRTALEQVEALASMLERAGAASLAMRLMHGRTRRLWAEGRYQPRGGLASSERAAAQKRVFDALEALAAAAPGPGAKRDLARYMKLFTELRRGEKRDERKR